MSTVTPSQGSEVSRRHDSHPAVPAQNQALFVIPRERGDGFPAATCWVSQTPHPVMDSPRRRTTCSSSRTLRNWPGVHEASGLSDGASVSATWRTDEDQSAVAELSDGRAAAARPKHSLRGSASLWTTASPRDPSHGRPSISGSTRWTDDATVCCARGSPSHRTRGEKGEQVRSSSFCDSGAWSSRNGRPSSTSTKRCACVMELSATRSHEHSMIQPSFSPSCRSPHTVARSATPGS
jgi:hypothetical protein